MTGPRPLKGNAMITMKILMMTVMIVTITIANGQSCDVAEELKDHCNCQMDIPGRFKITCSCEQDQNLTISGSAISTTQLAEFHINDCNASVLIKADAFGAPDYLENITFSSIAKLRLESESLRIYAVHPNDFSLIFDNIDDLYLEENAITIEGAGGDFMDETLLIRNTIIKNLPPHAINGSFNELLLEDIVLEGQAGSKAIYVGEVGTDITIKAFRTTTQGLGSEWLTGHVKALTITNSSLAMQPRAFAGIKMRGTPPPLKIAIAYNTFGYSKSEASLPSGVFDLDVSAGNVSITAENNHITCDCNDLAWLLENSKNDLQTQLGFVCKEGNLTSALDKCKAVEPNTSASMKSVFGVVFSLALMNIL